MEQVLVEVEVVVGMLVEGVLGVGEVMEQWFGGIDVDQVEVVCLVFEVGQQCVVVGCCVEVLVFLLLG